MPGKSLTPWLGFLRDVDRALNRSVDVPCLGGFVLIARRHSLCFHRVTIAEFPEGYASRLIDVTPRGFKRLRLRAFEIHDLELAKLGRNSARDRADVEFLVRKGLVDQDVLEKRYEAELRPYVLNEDRHTTTLRLWLGEFFGEKGGTAN